MEAAAVLRTAEVEAGQADSDPMQDGEAEGRQIAGKQDVRIEHKDAEVKSIFASEVQSAKHSPSAAAKVEAPAPAKQIFQQVAEHVKSIVTNNNVAQGESVTTINLEPGNLGQVSVQII